MQKKFLSSILVLLMVFSFVSNDNVVCAKKNKENYFNVYSPENPDVLFEQSYLDLANADISAKNGDVVCYATDDQTKEIFNELVSNSYNLEESIVENISDSKQLIGILTAKVGVEEIYEISEEGAPVCVSSKLQAPFEDSECGISELPTFSTSLTDSHINLSALEGSESMPYASTLTMINDRGYSTKENLTLSLAAYKVTPTSYNKEYYIWGVADWTTGLSGYSSPASGDDFFGFYWGGGLSSKDKSITLQAQNGSYRPSEITSSSYLSDSIANTGVVWGFKEYYADIHPSSLDIASIQATLYELSNHNSETTISSKYIHTYSTPTGAASFSTSGASFTLSSCSSQWSVVAEINEIPY